MRFNFYFTKNYFAATWVIQVLQLLAAHTGWVSCQGQDVWQASLWQLCGCRPPVHTCTETVKGTVDMALHSWGPLNFR